MLTSGSLAASVASLDPLQRERLLTDLTPAELAELEYEWRFWARPNQLDPAASQTGLSPWRVWLLLAGRGFGKTRVGAEWVREQVEKRGVSRIGLIGPTAPDVRDIMVCGESGILACSPPWNRPTYEPSKRRLIWPNGATAMMYSADEPDRLRGPQHEKIWADELAAWRYPEAWDMAMFGLRLGLHPQAVATTTPRPTKLVRELVADVYTAITRGSTFENQANLAPAFIDKLKKRYEGTRLGRQEIYAEILEDVAGALWGASMLEELRVNRAPDTLKRVVVGIDPSLSSEEGSDETGIIVAGLGEDDHVYVLEDLSCRESPEGWARIAVEAYHRWKADRIVAETNMGGEMVERVLRLVDDTVAFKAVHATRGKAVRAEPVAALYEQKRAHHVGFFDHLERQMCLFTPDFSRETAGFSPDRVDGLVWCVAELVIEQSFDALLQFYGQEIAKQRARRAEETAQSAAVLH